MLDVKPIGISIAAEALRGRIDWKYALGLFYHPY